MHILKILGFLFFLLTTGGKATAVSNQEADSFTSLTEVVLGVQDIEADISPDKSEELSDSTISGFVHTPGIFVSFSSQIDFYFFSLHKTRLLKQYIDFSKYISPGLDITDIIFPFHTFS